MNATEILVIILSIFLALFLLAGIILTLLLIRVTLQIRRVTTRAEFAAENIAAMTKNVSSVASKAVLGRLFLRGFRAVTKKGGKK